VNGTTATTITTSQTTAIHHVAWVEAEKARILG
jgi:hypothetical protein